MDARRESFALLFAIMQSLYFHANRYYVEIKEPMDFSTISKKLDEGAYATMEDFAKDVELIFRNCRTFNPPTTYPVTCADAVERVWKKEWAKAMERKLAWNEKRSLQSLMNKLVADPMWVLLFCSEVSI